MKRIRMAFWGIGLAWFAFCICGCNSQLSGTGAPDMGKGEIFTLVYAVSDDGLVNVRQSPSSKGAIVDTLWMMFHGLGNGVLLEEQDGWSKVRVRNHEGWVNNSYIGRQQWYDGTGDTILVAAKDSTPIYVESAEDGSKHNLYATVKKGTVLADRDFYVTKEHYVLTSGHDYLFIKLSDVSVVKK